MQSLLPDDNSEKPAIRVPNKHIIPAEAILVNKELGAGEFGVVQQGVWTNDRDRVSFNLLFFFFFFSVFLLFSKFLRTLTLFLCQFIISCIFVKVCVRGLCSP